LENKNPLRDPVEFKKNISVKDHETSKSKMKNNMLKVFLTILIFVTFSLHFFGCNSSGDSKDRSTIKGKQNEKAAGKNSYFPIAENMNWKYINEAPREETELYNINVVSVKSEGGSLLAEMDAFPFFTKTNEKTNLRISKSGEVFVKDGSGKENMFLPDESKLVKGYVWTFGDWSAYVTDSLETVKTEKGTYEDCLQVGFARGGITFAAQLWFAKDVGIVKWSNYRTNPPVRVITYYVLK
jgi:hypothetical protein